MAKLKKLAFSVSKVNFGVQVLFAVYLLVFFYSYYEARSAIVFSLNLERFPYLLNLNVSHQDLTRIVNFGVLLGVISTILWTVGIASRILSIVIWIVMAVLLNINIHLYQLHYPFINIVLISTCIMSSHKWFNFRLRIDYFTFENEEWKKYLHYLFSITLFMSGASKLFLDVWQDGTALLSLCSKSLLNALFANYCSWPVSYFKLITYSALFIELSAIFVFFEKVRKPLLILQLFLFLGVSLFVYVDNVGVGMVIAYLFLIEFGFLKKVL